MGQLPFPPDAELTSADRLVLGVLQKDYGLHDGASNKPLSDAAEESDDSATKRSEFVAPSPEGNIYLSRFKKFIGIVW
jgi:hypothetical protein